GLAPPGSLPGRGPGAVLPDREHRARAPADRGGQGRVPPLPGGGHLPQVGPRERPGRGRLGRALRGRAPRAQAPHRARPPREL
ncbi:MAG: WhiB-like transcription regulator, partial [uncultured Quadrisphaera sp.]